MINFEISEETKIIKALLFKAEPGELVPYWAITRAVGLDAQTRCKSYMATARRHLQRDEGYVFVAEPNKGLRRLTNDEKGDEAGDKAKRARRCAHRGEKVMRTIDWEILTTEQVRELTSTRMVLKIQHHVASKANRDRLTAIAERVSGKNLPPPANVMKAALEAMTGRRVLEEQPELPMADGE